MPVGLSDSELRGLDQLFSSVESPAGKYCLAQWEELDKIDIVLIAADNPRVLAKWDELKNRRVCPKAIYICNRDSEIDDLEILLNACFRPMRKVNVLESLDQLMTQTSPGDDAQIAV